MLRSLSFCLLLLTLAPIARGQTTTASDVEYEIGGPLAGVKLPLFPTQHGAPPGHPGAIPDLRDGSRFTTQGMPPLRQLYDGSIEQWRAYMFKYMPIRSFFDRQSQLRNWTAPALPGADESNVEQYAAPIFWVPRHREPEATGRHAAPVSVIRMKVGEPVLEFDLGELPVGMYVLRLIAAVEPEAVRPFREPLYLRTTVNDRLDGSVSSYRMRIGYCEEFYSIGEIYFHVPTQRTVRATVQVDEGSKVDMLVHNVSLDDALAGTELAQLKTRTTMYSAVEAAEKARLKLQAEGKESPERLSATQRLARDAALWRQMPPLNAGASTIAPRYTEGSGYGKIRGVSTGTPDMTDEQIIEQFGRWRRPDDLRRPTFPEGVDPAAVFLLNEKLGLVYTWDDLANQRPLPDPYPIKDDGAGFYFPDPENPAEGKVWAPIAYNVYQAIRDAYGAGEALAKYKETGRYDLGHDAALHLIRYAYSFPSFDFSRFISSGVHVRGPYGRDYWNRRRETIAFFLPHYPQYVDSIMYQYDELFDFIKDNDALAESVGRFVPWVRTPQDVIKLIDTYLVQTVAKRIMRYHYHTDPVDLANLAAVVGNAQVTEPWMQWVFARTHVYPLPPAGIADLMITGTTREGTEMVGSTYYASGEGASRIARSLGRYLKTGGLKKYDLSDPAQYPKPMAHVNWHIDRIVAGGEWMRIGDVTGPDKTANQWALNFAWAYDGWQWTREPRFAFVLAHHVGKQGNPKREIPPFDDAQWKAITDAAAKQPRAPWLELRSRAMPMWATVLESGTQHDDHRFRRAAYIRTGFGWGHHHNDVMDLQIAAHGLPMTLDDGQRPGYSTPGSRSTIVHNTVQVDGREYLDHSWTRVLADHPGAQYARIEAPGPGDVKLFSRQVVLMDVDEGEGSRKLEPALQFPRTALPLDVRTANSYVFDVFRVSGGKSHSYGFHGPLSDAFTWNATDAAPPAKGSPEAAHLAPFKVMPELSFTAAAPEILQATWRYAIENQNTARGVKALLGKAFDPQAPPAFTRLHMFDAASDLVLRAQAVCRQWKYDYTQLMVQRRSEQPRDSVFVAVIEPYVGEPFITDRRSLPVTGQQTDGARRAAAIEVTTRQGHVDVLMAGLPEKPHDVEVGPGITFNGELAIVSRDQHGPRLLMLAGGTKLHVAGSGELPAAFAITLDTALREAEITAVDYQARTFTVSKPWPARTAEHVVETGIPGHYTNYTVLGVAPAESGESGARMALERGGDFMRTRLKQIDVPEQTVTGVLDPLIEYIPNNRMGWVVSNDDATEFWRATYLGSARWKLTGDKPFNAETFGDDPVLRAWEYGVGDTVRQRTSASLRRGEAGTWELRSDVGLTLTWADQGRTLSWSSDGKTWSSPTASLKLTDDQVIDKVVYIKVQ